LFLTPRHITRRRLLAGAAITLALAAGPAALAAAPASAAAPTGVDTPCRPPGPWTIRTAAINIRSKPTTHSTVLGVLYKGQKFKVYSSNGYWVHIKDLTTGVTGYVSETYLNRTYYTCLD
jgi:uncharacterized protein YgiM (DUF1202 family)